MSKDDLTCREAGRRGAKALQAKYGDALKEMRAAAGRKGGSKTAKRGSAYYQEIGRKGGQANVARHDEEHFAELGRRGGRAAQAKRTDRDG